MTRSIQTSVDQLHDCLLDRGMDRCLLAVSGGRDSMVLLDALHRIGPRNLQIGVAHFNHHLRGKESDADEALVRRVCARRRIRCFLGHGYFADRAGARRESMEMAARSLRYAFLREVAGSEGFRCVVTAHHAEDQLELFLLRLARGAGGDGLAGMSFVDSLPGDPNILLLRPLLQVDRSAIREWASTHRVLFREDRSNRSTEILRNRIRIRVLPMLRRELGEEVATGIGRSIDIVTAESDCIRQLASGWLSRMSPRAAFNKLPIAVQRQVLRLQLLDFGMDPGFNGVETLRRAPESVVTLPGGDRVVRAASGRIRRAKSTVANSSGSFLQEIQLRGNRGAIEAQGVIIRWQARTTWSASWLRRAKVGVEALDLDRLGSNLGLRQWQPGDRFHRMGLPGPVKLQDLFTNRKIPPALRRRLLILTTSDGAIAWVEGFPPAEPYKVTSETRRCLIWRWERNKGRRLAAAKRNRSSARSGAAV